VLNFLEELHDLKEATLLDARHFFAGKVVQDDDKFKCENKKSTPIGVLRECWTMVYNLNRFGRVIVEHFIGDSISGACFDSVDHRRRLVQINDDRNRMKSQQYQVLLLELERHLLSSMFILRRTFINAIIFSYHDLCVT
jgi:hypothetical protein